MNKIFDNFSKYFTTGVANTLLHWFVFAIIYYATKDQSISNLIGFTCAVTFSFIINAKYTFNSEINIKKYLLYLSFMGFMSYLFGWVGMKLQLHALITLVLFSLSSLLIGFLYSKYIVFKE